MAFLQGLFGPPSIARLAARRDIRGLFKALKYRNDYQVRRAAAIALGETRDVRAIEPLIAALNDEQYSVRLAAVDALGKSGHARGIEALAAILTDDGSLMKQEALRALSMIGDNNATDALAAALVVSHSSMRQSIVPVLDRLGWRPSSDAAGTAYYLTKHDWQRCLDIGPAGLDVLISALRRGAYSDRFTAAKTLVALYRSDRLDAECTQRILSEQATIATPHQDSCSHSDTADTHDDRPHTDADVPRSSHYDYAGYTTTPGPEHTDTGGHTDEAHVDTGYRGGSYYSGHVDSGIGLAL